MMPCLFIRRLGVDVAPPVTMVAILRDTAERHRFTVRDLTRWSVAFTADPTEQARTRARDEAMWRMRTLPDPKNLRTGRRLSLHQIGEFMGCHHTTVLAAARRHEARAAMRVAAE